MRGQPTSTAITATQKSGRPTRAATVSWRVRGAVTGLLEEAVEMASYLIFAEYVTFSPAFTVTEPLFGLPASWKVAIS